MTANQRIFPSQTVPTLARKYSGLSWACLLVLLCLAACTAAVDPAEMAAPAGAAFTATLTVAPTETAAPTATIPPTLTPTPSATPTATPTATATPTITPLPCWRRGGRFDQSSLRSDYLKLPMEYSVYLPPCYDELPARRYPVLYLIHGMNYNNDQWDRLGADETADALVAAGEVEPFIIIMPRDRNWGLPEEDMFGQVLVDELLPLIDQNYRTLPERSYRSIGGLSRGAGWAVHLGLSRWDLFGAIGGHSLPVFWSDTNKIRGWLDAIPDGSMPRIYLDIGAKDRQTIMFSALWFENLLTERGVPHEWYLFPGYHEEAYWQAHVDEYLTWYAQDW